MTKVEKFKQYLIDLFSEASTWRSVAFFTAIVAGKSELLGSIPDEHILFAATTAAYTVGLIFKDKV